MDRVMSMLRTLRCEGERKRLKDSGWNMDGSLELYFGFGTVLLNM